MSDTPMPTRQEVEVLIAIRDDCMYNPPDADSKLVMRGLFHVHAIASQYRGNRLTPLGHRMLTLFEDERQRQADEDSQRHAQERAQREQAVMDAQRDHRHDFKVAAFSVGLTLLAEHFVDLVQLIQGAVEKVLVWFHP